MVLHLLPNIDTFLSFSNNMNGLRLSVVPRKSTHCMHEFLQNKVVLHERPHSIILNHNKTPINKYFLLFMHANINLQHTYPIILLLARMYDLNGLNI